MNNLQIIGKLETPINIIAKIYEIGPVGPTGEQGDIGFTGNTGLQGIQGIKGDTGATGFSYTDTMADARIAAKTNVAGGIASLLEADNNKSALQKTLTQSAPVSLAGTSDTNLIPINFKDGSLIEASFSGMSLVNIVSNGNFASGINGWTPSFGTTSATANVATSTGDGSGVHPRIETITSQTAITGHSIYARMLVRVTNSLATDIALTIIDGALSASFFLANPIINTWYVVSGVYVISASATGSLKIRPTHTYVDTATANGKVMEIKEVMTIDLTANGVSALTLPQATNLAPNWFNGTANVVNPQLRSCGKNLFNEVWENGWINSAGVAVNGIGCRTASFISLNPSLTYIVSSGSPLYVIKYDINHNFIITSATGVPFTGANFIKLRKQVGDNVFPLNTMLEQSPIATPYETYKESKLNITGIARSVADLMSLKNETTYNTTTWAEWTKTAGVVGDITGLGLTFSNSIFTSASIPTALKPSAKYGILVNVVSNNIPSKVLTISNNLTGNYEEWLTSTSVGNVKKIITTQATISVNIFKFSPNTLGDGGYLLKLKDFRVIELPVGSQIEADFNNLTADQLVVKYPYWNNISNFLTGTISSDNVSYINGVCKIDRWVDSTTGLKLTNQIIGEVLPSTGSLVAYKNGITFFENTLIIPSVNYSYLMDLTNIQSSQLPDNLLGTYTYNGNKELVISDVDTANNTFTSAAHGLANGNLIYPFSNLNSGDPHCFYFMPLVTYPTYTYFVVQATTDTFKIALTSGGAEVDLITNATMDLTKWHFEVVPNVTHIIAGLPNLTRIRVKISGRMAQNGSIYLLPTNHVNNNKFLNTAGGVGYPNQPGSLCNCYFRYNLVYDSSAGLGIYGDLASWYQNTTTLSTISYNFATINLVDLFSEDTLVSLSFGNANVANGFKIEVYAL